MNDLGTSFRERIELYLITWVPAVKTRQQAKEYYKAQNEEDQLSIREHVVLDFLYENALKFDYKALEEQVIQERYGKQLTII